MSGSAISRRSTTRVDKEREFRFLILLATIAFLPIAALARLVPRMPGSVSFTDGRRQSVFSEAREAAQTVIPFAFMG